MTVFVSPAAVKAAGRSSSWNGANSSNECRLIGGECSGRIIRQIYPVFDFIAARSLLIVAGNVPVFVLISAVSSLMPWIFAVSVLIAAVSRSILVTWVAMVPTWVPTAVIWF